MLTYGTSAIPSTTITVREKSTTAVSLAFDNAVGIVGGYDSANGSITSSDENTNIEIDDADDALEKFGENSELYTQVQLAYLNGAGRIVCTPVGESSTTESVTGVSSITLSGTPIDPRFNPDEEITAIDTSSGDTITVNYVDGTPSTPSDGNTLNINPQTGEGEFSSSSDYDVTYTDGDYTTATTEAAKANVRFSAVCSANTSAIGNELSTINTQAQTLDLKRMVGAVPTAVTPLDYNIPHDDQRLVLGAPSYGTTIFNGKKAMLTVAIASQMASEPLGSAAYGNQINGFESLSQEFEISDLQDFGDDSKEVDRVTAIYEGLGGYEIVEDLTTSTGEKFDDVYRCEIIDDIIYSVNVAADAFIDSNSPNTPESRATGLEAPIRSVLRGARDNTPPLISTTDGSKPYTVSTSADKTDDEKVNVSLGLDITDLAKSVDVSIGVGTINTYGGAE